MFQMKIALTELESVGELWKIGCPVGFGNALLQEPMATRTGPLKQAHHGSFSTGHSEPHSNSMAGGRKY